MEHSNLDGKEEFQDENAMPFTSNSSGNLEQDGHRSSITLSEFKTEFEKMSSKLSLQSDVMQTNSKEKCCHTSCPCGNELSFSNYIGFVSPRKSLQQRKTSYPLSLLHRTASLFNVPMNLRSAGFSFDGRKSIRRTRSIHNVNDLFLECPSASGRRDIIISPSGRWIFDTILGSTKSRSLLDSSLFFQLGVLDGEMSRCGPRSATRSSELTTSGFRNTSLQKTRVQLVPFGEQRFELNNSERKPVACSSTSSTCSYDSTTSANLSFSKGSLYCMWKSGIPYFAFSLDNDCGEVYVANPLKIQSSAGKPLDYMYLFRSRTNSKRDSRSHCGNTSGFVGKMKVSSSVVLSSSKSKFIETEFVLFGSHDDHSREMQRLPTTFTKSKGLSEKIMEIFRPTHVLRHKSIHKAGEPNFSFDEVMQEMLVDELGDTNKFDRVNCLAHDFPSNLELAAIVVKDYQHNTNKEAAVGGWGLKFLDKAEVSNIEPSFEEPSFACENCGGGCTRASTDSTRRMEVVVPAGFHGGPIERTGGPSSLTERWRSGGHCDCGGWDLGCPLTVLNDNATYSKASSKEESGEDCKSFNLFVEGTKHCEPTLRMENTSNGRYHIYFQSALSALQSFAIAVAIIHTHTPGLHPKL